MAPAQVVEFEQGGEKNGDECQRKVAAMAEKPGTRFFKVISQRHWHDAKDSVSLQQAAFFPTLATQP
jgi:hypothetical protein